MREFCKDHSKGIIFSIIVMLFLFAFLINHIQLFYNYIHNTPQCDAVPEINAWLCFLTASGTAALAFIAYWKIEDINTQSEADFLLRIDKRWGNSEAIKARIIIHKLYRNIHKTHKKYLIPLNKQWDATEKKQAEIYIKNLYKKTCKEFEGINFESEDKNDFTKDDFIQAIIGIKIVKMSTNVSLTSDFICLLSFLDFMETIGFFSENETHVSVKKLNALCGESLRFNYKIFKPYIDYKNNKHKKTKDYEMFYKNFGKLYDLLKNDENSSKNQHH